MLRKIAYALAAVVVLAGGVAMSQQATAQVKAGGFAAGPGVGGQQVGRNKAPAPGDGNGAAAAARKCYQVGARMACVDKPRRKWWREGEHRCCHRHVRKVRMRWHGKMIWGYAYGRPHCHSGKLFLKHCVMGRY